MITFSKFEQYGNLGNQLFQYASMLGIADEHADEVCLPRWKWDSYLKNKPTIKKLDLSPDQFPNIHSFYNEPSYDYTPVELSEFKDYDFCGWFQSEKYWIHCKEYVMEMLEFEPLHVNRVRSQYHRVLDKKTIAISIRRGDYVDNPNYELLNANYYYLALLEHFPDWREYSILIFSDDIPYCKVHFQCLPNVTFIEGLNPMEQLILGSMCDNFIVANSTFSWWMAYLGEKEHSKIIRPNYHFAGELLRTSDWKDYYPERWTTFDHKGKRIQLHDATFIIPVDIDSQDRAENKQITTANLQSWFETNILIGSPLSDYGVFHRTRWLNKFTSLCHTPIVVNYDCDILTPPLQMYLAVEMLRNGEADFVYPYDGRFARCPRSWVPIMNKYNDVGMFRDAHFVGCRPFDGKSVGGVIAYRKDKFIEAGGENEKMISYAPEDQERFYRFNKLGYRVARVPGAVYHLDHQITANSSTTHPDYIANESEFSKVKAMGDKELRDYVDSWGYFQCAPTAPR